MAYGPIFQPGLYDTLPTANVDIAPTVAHILGLGMPDVQGRRLDEALRGGPRLSDYAVSVRTYRSSTRTGLTMKLPTDLDGAAIDRARTTYAVELVTKTVSRGGVGYTYFDQAKALCE